MVILRVLGAVIIAISGFGAAYVLNVGVREGITEVQSVISLIRFLRSEIECFSMPVPRALSRCPKEILVGCGYTDSCPPASIYSLTEHLSNGAVQTQLVRFCEEIGKGYREEQLSLCDYYISVFEEQRRELAQQLPMRKKVNLTLCISSALAVVILLI